MKKKNMTKNDRMWKIKFISFDNQLFPRKSEMNSRIKFTICSCVSVVSMVTSIFDIHIRTLIHWQNRSSSSSSHISGGGSTLCVCVHYCVTVLSLPILHIPEIPFGRKMDSSPREYNHIQCVTCEEPCGW